MSVAAPWDPGLAGALSRTRRCSGPVRSRRGRGHRHASAERCHGCAECTVGRGAGRHAPPDAGPHRRIDAKLHDRVTDRILGRVDAPRPGRRPRVNACAAAPSASDSAPCGSWWPVTPITSQQEFVDLLAERGFDVTQATVSRDIAELGLVKVVRADRHVYASPEDLAPAAATDATLRCACWMTCPSRSAARVSRCCSSPRPGTAERPGPGHRRVEPPASRRARSRATTRSWCCSRTRSARALAG